MKSKTKPHLIFLRYIFDVSSILNNVPSKASWPNESQLFRNGVTAIPKIGSYALPTYSMIHQLCFLRDSPVCVSFGIHQFVSPSEFTRGRGHA
ncbi:uncharacterized protein LOC120088181 isoform X2 [Benincasa hispida]|uniref:uncharacterized protein LOC120088181 isoform X2 n=1 Tax=Benincasa hispida TaxID=102211 RepID=UPI0019027900|nr:uncharacterized protein LOC120088181 isoform X2 [Benincasa hispida]